MITSLAHYPAVVAARQAHAIQSGQVPAVAERAYEVYESRLNVVVRLMIDAARPLETICKRNMYRLLMDKSKLGATYAERRYMFDRAWEKAANTSRRQYVDNIDDPAGSGFGRVHSSKPPPLRRSSRPRRNSRAA